ncbi:hypothetical protein D5085_01250 [Ectothiorhodospiraceae bacterium BW-2]|nr:hypothetical protein D5085_01250 [Ectothiorhodospiraceae bacterium BW-2]
MQLKKLTKITKLCLFPVSYSVYLLIAPLLPPDSTFISRQGWSQGILTLRGVIDTGKQQAKLIQHDCAGGVGTASFKFKS